MVWKNCRHHDDGWVDKYILVIWNEKMQSKNEKVLNVLIIFNICLKILYFRLIQLTIS